MSNALLSDLDRLHLERSRFLDAFSDLEAAICRILHSVGEPPSPEPFGQRLEKFRKAEKTSLIARANYGERDQIADAVAELLRIRADIVHSRIKPSLINDEVVALFANSQEAISRFPLHRAITLRQFAEMLRELSSLQDRVKNLNRTNPPSSPPPPSPGAAGGP